MATAAKAVRCTQMIGSRGSLDRRSKLKVSKASAPSHSRPTVFWAGENPRSDSLIDRKLVPQIDARRNR